MKKYWGFLFLMIVVPVCLVSAEPQTSEPAPFVQNWEPKELTAEERAYFETLYQETWNYLAALVEPSTGVPYDSSAAQPVTSMSNIGFYLSATAVAAKTGLITHEEAVARATRVVEALEKVEKWKGFPRPWILVRTLVPSFGEEFTYDTHMSVLVGSLVVTKNILRELDERITMLLTGMKFRELYDPKTGWLKGGYNVKHQNFAIYQPWGHWYYKNFASGVRLLSFYGIAKGQIPKEHWKSLVRTVREMGDEEILATGYEEAGLDIQFVTSLFLDERFTEMGESERNYVQYQMDHAKKIKAPVWGWASCQTTRGRYLTFGDMKDEVVAPYASVLAAIYYPTEAHENLQNLELLGARTPFTSTLYNGNFGFQDSVNWETKEAVKVHLTPSQGMSFLALANILHDGIVWKTFQNDPTVEKGLDMLKLNVPREPKIEEGVTDVETANF